MPRSAMIMSAAGDEAAARRSSQAARARKAGCTRIRSGLCLTLLLVSVIGGVLPASAQTSTVVVLLDDPGWSASAQEGSAVQIDAANPRAGQGSLELVTGIGATAAFIHEIADPGFGTIGQLKTLAFDWFIDPASKVALPPDLALRVYPFGDPRSFFLHWDTCSPPVPCVPYPTGSWQATDLIEHLSIQSADGNPPPASMADVPVNAPIVGIHVRGSSALGQRWHGFVDNVTIAFEGHDPITYNFESEDGAPGGIISGRVTDAATGAGILVPVSFYNSSGNFVARLDTDAAGAYSSSALTPGVYYAKAAPHVMGGLFAHQLYNNLACVNCTVTMGRPISVTHGGTTSNINFALAVRGHLDGQVTDAATGVGLSSSVSLYDSNGTFIGSVPTSSSGSYNTFFTGGLPAGTYFARTENSRGFINKLYNNLTCPGCDVTTGTPITIVARADTPNINFALNAGWTLSWPPPASIVYGTALGPTQLSATASIPGAFVYTPIAGTVLQAGNGRILSTTFTPEDTNFGVGTGSVSIDVLKATTTITWPAPPTVSSGTPLGANQLNATASVAGTFVYTPAAGTVLNVGPQTLSVIFTPSDSTNYTKATKTISTVAVDGHASVNVNATSIGAGAIITVMVADGPGNATDWVALYRVGSSAEVEWKFLNGARTAPAAAVTGATLTFTLPTGPGTYTLRFYANNTYTLLATSATITVTGATVTPSATIVTSGATLMATIANGPGNRMDWVGLYAVDGKSELDWQFLNGSRTPPATGVTAAAVPITMPARAGTYALKLFANNTYTLLATSQTITVSSPPAISFTVSATALSPGAVVTATITNGPGNATDWVGLYFVGGTTEVDWKFLNGSKTAPAVGLTNAVVSFTMPATPGTYTLKVYSNNTYTLLAIITPITVSPSAPLAFTVSETSVAPGTTVMAAIANGPGNAMDWVGLYIAGNASEVDWKFLNGARTAPAAGMTDATLPFTMPTTPGTYVVRFYSNNTYNVLATRMVTVQ
jgi:hypothetical protein